MSASADAAHFRRTFHDIARHHGATRWRPLDTSPVYGDLFGNNLLHAVDAWSGAVELPEEEVDIFLSAGPREGEPGDAAYRSCNNSNIQTCSMWWIRWSFLRREALYVQRVATAGTSDACPGGYNFFEPALSPDGTKLAMASRCFDSSNAVWAGGLVAVDGVTGDKALVLSPTVTSLLPAYPTWIDESTVWHSSSRASKGCAADMSTGWSTTLWAGSPAPAAQIGLDAGVHTDVSYADAEYTDNARGAGLERIVSFGGACDERVPRVTDVAGDNEEPFDLSQTDVDFTECHHPSWSTDGESVVCTRIQAQEDHPDGFPRKVSRLFRFKSGWRILGSDGSVSPTRVWKTDVAEADEFLPILSGAEFGKIPENGAGTPSPEIFPEFESGSPTCQNYVWKCAEWCGRPDFLIATVYCSDASDKATPQRALRSRVVLIDISSPPTAATAYTDLTSLVEDSADAGATRGAYDGVFATCGAVKS